MPSEVLWESSPSLTSYLTTELNSLANDGNKLGAEIDNSAGLKTFMDVEVNLAAQGSARSVGATVAIFLILAPDGTNYWFGDDSLDANADKLIATVGFDAATNARRNGRQMLVVPPGKFKLLVENKTGQALAASGNTVSYRLYSLENQ